MTRRILNMSVATYKTLSQSYIDRGIRELGPAGEVVHVVFHRVVFGKIRYIRLLCVDHVRRTELTDIHDSVVKGCLIRCSDEESLLSGSTSI